MLLGFILLLSLKVLFVKFSGALNLLQIATTDSLEGAYASVALGIAFLFQTKK